MREETAKRFARASKGRRRPRLAREQRQPEVMGKERVVGQMLHFSRWSARWWRTHSLKLLVVLLHKLCIDLNFRRSKGRGGDKVEAWVANELSGEPQEGLLEVVVGLCRELKVLKVFLSVESHSTSLDFALLQIVVYSARQMRTASVSNAMTWSVRTLLRMHKLTFTSTLLPQRTIGIFSQTRSRSLCQLGTFL